jgi:uncharacterized protein YndB with AHSA1/START domain
MVPQRIEREILIEAPVDVVWAVVTDPEHISGWFSDSVELDLTPGGEVLLQWDGRGGVPGRVERVERPHLFSFRWAVGPDVPGEEHWTLVEFRLSAEGDSTRLTVVESGFRDLAGPDDEKQQHVDSHTRGWKLELGHLEEYVAQRTGTPADR